MKKSLIIVVVFMGLFLLSACDGTKNKVEKNYSKLGKYDVKRYPVQGLSENYVVYYPSDAISKDMPVVLFLEGGGSIVKIDNYSGIMKFLASKGYFVIGAESGESYDSKYGKDIVENAINKAKETHGLSISKLAVMGHSQGGGQAFYVMKKLRDKGYGNKVNVILSIDGWFAFSMNKSDFKGLDSRVSFIQMNGLKGTGTDPRVNLSIWSLLKNASKSFYILPNENHSYVMGELSDLLNNKKDLLFLVDALLDDAFTNSSYGENLIPKINRSSYDAINNVLKDEDKYHEDCNGIKYNAVAQLINNDVDYCEK